MSKSCFISGQNVFLRKVAVTDANEEYLSWLNDPDVMRYRSSRGYPSNMDDLVNYLKSAQSSRDLYLAICLKEAGRHIGGISLTAIHFVHRTAALNIMIGDKKRWGKNYGTEAVDLLTRHAFLSLNLNKVWAESPNPAFIHLVEKLGWAHEGTKRQMFMLEGQFIDMQCYGILKSEYLERAKGV